MAFTAAISSAIFSSPVWSDPAAAPANYSLTTPGGIAVPGGVVPDGTCGVVVSSTGGGGASSAQSGTGNNGGHGAIIGATFKVLPLQAVTGTVAQGGRFDNTSANNPAGGTGNAAGGTAGTEAGVTGTFHHGGGGGGSTALFVGGLKLLEAAGGGGAGTGHSNGAGAGGNGGFAGIAAAGVAAGLAGTNGDQSIGNSGVSTLAVGAGGGGQIAAPIFPALPVGTGGTAGVNGANAARNGTAGNPDTGANPGQGGNGGPDPDVDTGGGGGGGYSGGGGGASTLGRAQTGAGGGGGSSYVRMQSPTFGATATTGVSGVVGTNGGPQTSSTNGGNGAVSLTWQPCNYTLVVNKSASPTPANAGAKTTWTIAITNTGPDPMSRSDTISLADTLPGPVTGTPTYRVLSIANSGGTNSTDLTNDPITCTGVTVGSTMPAATTCTRPYNSSPSPGGTVGNNGTRGLNPGETLTITYEQIFPNTAACGPITNTASFRDRAGGVISALKTSTGSVTINCYDLSVAKTVSQTSTVTGTVLTWNIQVTNNGPANMFGPDATTANNLSVNDSAPTTNVGLPTNFTSTGPATGCTYTSPTISCTSGLNAGQTQTFTFQQTINAGTAVGTNISNTATVTDFNPADVDTITRTFTVPAPTIQITKVGVGGGGTFTFNGGNGFGTDSIVVPAAGGTTAGAVKPLTAINTATTVTETIPPGWTAALTSCTGAVAGSYSFTAGTGALAFTNAAIQAGNVIQCTITNTKQPTLSLQKALGAPGRIAVADQFTLSGTGTGAPASINTTGAGTAVTSAAYNFTATIGTAYSLNEAMAAGSVSVLGKYSQAVVCANSWPTANGGTNVSGLTTLPVNVTPVAGDAITCTVTNTPKAPTLSMQKSLGGTGRIAVADQFSLSGTGTGAPAAVATTGAGTAITSAAYAFTATSGSAYVLNEAMAAGSSSSLLQYTQGVACTNTLVGGTNVSGLTTLPINVTPAFGDAISCVVTNSPKAPTLSLQKILGGTGRIAAVDQFALSGTGTGAPAAINTTGAGTAVTSAAYGFTATAGSAYALNEAMAAGSASSLLKYAQNVSCANGFAGGTNVSGLTTVPINVTPVHGDTISCTITNTPKAPVLSLQKQLGGTGRIAAADQFSLSGTGTGAPAAISTTGSGTAVTSAAYSFNATAASAYTLNEAMAAGSASLFGQYTQLVSCNNTLTVANGGTNVSGLNALPINVTLVHGDAISCTVTNTPKAPTLSLQKILGGTGRIAVADQFSLSGIGTGSPAAVTTTGAGTAVTSAAYSFTATASSPYVLNEAMAAGSASTLLKYTQAVACTNGFAGGSNVSGITSLPINLSPAHGDVISCNITNTPKAPTLAWQKQLGGIGRIAVADQFSLSGTGTGAPAAITTTGTGTTVSSAAYNFTATPASAYTLNEAMAAGSTSVFGQYAQIVSCTNTLTVGNGGTNVSGFTTLPVNITPVHGDVISCTVTNTPRATTLQLVKTWGANNIATDIASIGPTTGGAANTLAFTANAGTPNNSGTPVNIAAGNTINLPAETFSAGAVTNYDTSIACTTNLGATANTVSSFNGQNPNTLLIAANDTGKNVTCTYNNTRKSSQFRLTKTWDAGSTAGNVANFAATSGLITNTNSFSSTAQTSSSSNTVTVYAGEQATLPAETMSVGTIATYLTQLSCNAGTLTGTNGQTPGNTLAITALATATNPIICTYANTKVNANLTISKVATYSPSPVIKNQLITYTYKVFNNGNVPMTNVQVRDMHGTPAVQVALGASGITSETLSIPGPGGVGASPDSTPNDGIWTTLAPGAEVTFTYTHQVTQAEIDNG